MAANTEKRLSDLEAMMSKVTAHNETADGRLKGLEDVVDEHTASAERMSVRTGKLEGALDSWVDKATRNRVRIEKLEAQAHGDKVGIEALFDDARESRAEIRTALLAKVTALRRTLDGPNPDVSDGDVEELVALVEAFMGVV